MLRLCLSFAIISLALSHLCLISPHQRSTMAGVNAAGANDCLRLKEDCGGEAPVTPTQGFLAGSKQNFTFQKNLNHYNAKAPGFFSLGIGMAGEMKFEPLIKNIPDTNSSSLSLYTVEVMLPKKPMAHAVIQVVYMTNNPNAPKAFYQCADIATVETQKL
ncbi:uncharacterized protein LOC134195777 [Corticium candelabrum]|uniref:uncharacterized protein LOC134195777 n=1 Tax=Corticium candelabrum TaxID=121492 RepID=UPI002E25A93F|nr:uncharacterized protein LOC134195777 [Corticium candelabrum]